MVSGHVGILSHQPICATAGTAHLAVGRLRRRRPDDAPPSSLPAVGNWPLSRCEPSCHEITCWGSRASALLSDRDRLGLGMTCQSPSGVPGRLRGIPERLSQGSRRAVAARSEATQSTTLPGGVEMARSRAGSPTRATRYSQSYLNMPTGHPALP